jgi:pimeloyl-ACP methyl ester carboxylesterase
MEAASRWRTVAGRRVHEHAFDHGSPRALPYVLVHGLGVSGRYFLPLARRLARVARVYVPDLPGNGPSEKPPRPLDVPGLAAALGAWADVAGVERACVVGNSLGGQTVVELAVTRPELVARLVLVGPTFDPAASTVLRQLGRLVATGIREPPSLTALVVAEYTAAGPLRTLTTARHGLAHRIEQKLGRVRVPTLVLRGERDRICTQAWAERVAAGIQDARLAVLAGKAHAVHYSAPDEVARLVLRTPAGAAAVSRA